MEVFTVAVLNIFLVGLVSTCMHNLVGKLCFMNYINHEIV